MTRRLTAPRLLIASHNAGKLAELRDLLAPRGIEAVGAAAFDLPEPPEAETSFVGNARLKAHAAASAISIPALADDSGLTVDALGGAPGVETADWAMTPGGRDFTLGMRRVHDALRAAGAAYPCAAQFRSTIVVAWPDGEDLVFEGVAPGTLTWPARGERGHGFDPIFVPEGQPLTFAEMDAAAKNRLSHRAQAFARFAAACLG